jgi:hypothetical protein
LGFENQSFFEELYLIMITIAKESADLSDFDLKSMAGKALLILDFLKRKLVDYRLLKKDIESIQSIGMNSNSKYHAFKKAY